MSILNFLLTLLFPRRCVVCGQVGRYLCHQCQAKIKPLEFQVCPVCERPAVDGATHPKCRKRLGLDGLTSFFVYDGPIKKAIKELKYRFVTDLAGDLVALAFGDSTSAEVESLKKLRSFVLIPVPLHRRRFNWRGFNQAEILGRMMAKKLGVKFISDLLVRKKNTKPQVELKSKKRQENIEGAFSINPRYRLILNTEYLILIFDDVWTTGSTLKACAKVLKEAGIKEVWGITLAR